MFLDLPLANFGAKSTDRRLKLITINQTKNESPHINFGNFQVKNNFRKLTLIHLIQRVKITASPKTIKKCAQCFAHCLESVDDCKKQSRQVGNVFFLSFNVCFLDVSKSYAQKLLESIGLENQCANQYRELSDTDLCIYSFYSSCRKILCKNLCQIDRSPSCTGGRQNLSKLNNCFPREEAKVNPRIITNEETKRD